MLKRGSNSVHRLEDPTTDAAFTPHQVNDSQKPINKFLEHVSHTQEDLLDIESIRSLAEKGDQYAQTLLGTIYSYRMSCLDDSKALEWFRKAAAQGNPDAQFKIGVMHNNGRATAQNSGEADVWFRKAAKQGNQEAISALGLRDERITTSSLSKYLHQLPISVLDLAGNNLNLEEIELLLTRQLNR